MPLNGHHLCPPMKRHMSAFDGDRVLKVRSLVIQVRLMSKSVFVQSMVLVSKVAQTLFVTVVDGAINCAICCLAQLTRNVFVVFFSSLHFYTRGK